MLEDAALLEFQWALLDGLTMFASSGLLDHTLNTDSTILARQGTLINLQDVLSCYYPMAHPTDEEQIAL